MKINYLCVCTLFLLGVLWSCDDQYAMPVPEAGRFAFEVNLADHKSFGSLTSSMGAIKRKGNNCNGACGYKGHGVILFRYVYEHEIFAYDATCPASAECIEGGVVEINPARTSYGKCARCGAEYSFVDGHSTTQRVKLRPYNVTPIMNVTGQFTVSNR